MPKLFADNSWKYTPFMLSIEDVNARLAPLVDALERLDALKTGQTPMTGRLVNISVREWNAVGDVLKEYRRLKGEG